MPTCPACGQPVPDLDAHVEGSPECLRAIEMDLIDSEE